MGNQGPTNPPMPISIVENLLSNLYCFINTISDVTSILTTSQNSQEAEASCYYL